MKKTEHQGISFDRFIIERINLEINPGFIRKEDGISVDASFKVKRTIEEAKRLLTIKFETSLFEKSDNPPMKMSISAAGFFSLKENEDIKILHDFSRIQGPALMFPFLREVIADLTMKTGFPPLLLPPTNIHKLIGMRKKKKEK